ncbi:RNA polymerase sigma factor [Adhaeribacter radiodurans]|uniref:RNA polymerase sigma factor n=1 Tax=Adhaeribacter radiodurans TaxID=2745197 RepID=A0A7L7LE85_9BACT|nr:RNA polymerase sigma factor [Adhaeribacter radiodurans]QMU31172.1 RNA polymerase sigma factor [Adhaeribacter radiodurans]
METQPDYYYVQQVLCGNTAGYTVLVEKYKHLATTLAFKITGNKQDAEEVAQDAFVKAFRALPGFRSESKFSTWLYRIVYNSAISKTRRKISFAVSLEDADLTETELEQVGLQMLNLQTAEQSKYIDLALSQLPAHENLLLTLFYLHEKSVEEIKEITGLSKANIKVKLFRGRQKMYLYLQGVLKHEWKEIIR